LGRFEAWKLHDGALERLVFWLLADEKWNQTVLMPSKKPAICRQNVGLLD